MLHRLSLLVLSLFLLATSTFSCKQEELTIDDAPLSIGKIVAEGPILLAEPASLHEFFLKRFQTKEITLVDVIKANDDYYLYAEGLDSNPLADDGATIVMRWILEEKDGKLDFPRHPSSESKSVSSISAEDLPVAGFGESCSGAPCSHCAFVETGGCLCRSGGAGKCNHTVTKEDDPT